MASRNPNTPSMRVLTRPPAPSPSPIPTLSPDPQPSFQSNPRSLEGVVVVGILSRNPDHSTHLINRVLDSNVFGSGHLDKALFADKDEVKDWCKKRRISYYHEEEKGFLFLQFCSTRCSVTHGFSCSGLEELEFEELQGLLFMFSVCHVILYIQEGTHFDTHVLQKFRILQASKHALSPYVRSGIISSLSSRPQSLSSSSRLTSSTGSSPGRSSFISRDSSSVSIMSGLGSYASLFPGYCTPVMLFVFVDDFLEGMNSGSNVESTDSSSFNQSSGLSSVDRPNAPAKGSGSVVVLARPLSKSEGGFKKKLQSSLEFNLRMSTADSLSASGRSSEKLSLPLLQSKMKIDPEGYETELGLVYNQFKSALDLFQQQAALNFASSSGVCADPTISKDLSDRASFLAHVTPFYPKQLAEFPAQLAEFLKSSARTLPSGLRCHVTQALILLINRDMVDISETLALFMELQTLGDRTLRNLAFTHVVHSIRKMNKKHKNEAKNRALQNILFVMLQQDDEARAKRALITLCELHRRKVWFDDRTANSICMACFHSSSRIMIAALSFLLDYEKIEDDDDDDSDASSGEDDPNPRSAQVVISKESIYKAHNQGTVSSKKKKKAKLQRAIRSMKRQQRLSSENNNSNYYSPFNHLKDAQGFAERLFSGLQTCNERFEVKMMMLKVIARTVGLHRLILLNFYPFLQKYVQPHQRDITNLLAAAVQACHDMVPPDAVEPLFKQIVNQFVHDRSRPEAIAVGLNVIREICLRIPLLMNEDLLQDLVLYKKSHEKAVSVAARSLITLFREVCPSLLIKKDRGRPIDPKARPKAYGEINIVSSVPGAELLEQLDYNVEDKEDSDNVDDLASRGSDEDSENDEMVSAGDEGDQVDSDDAESEDGDVQDGDDAVDSDGGGGYAEEDEDQEENDEDSNVVDDEFDNANVAHETNESNARAIVNKVNKSPSRKRKFSDFDGQLLAADTSLRALKKMTEEKLKKPPSDSTDGILSNEDFRRIKELTAKKDAKIALTRQGFKVPSSDDLSAKRVDPAKLEAHVRAKLSKEERLAMVRAGREDRESYKSKIAVKQKKTGGESNRQKEHKKQMPLAAKRAKVERSRQEKKRKQNRSGKQFRGKKAWK